MMKKRFIILLLSLFMGPFISPASSYASTTDNFEYPTGAALDSAYSIECDPGSYLGLFSDSISFWQGEYCAKLTYTLNGLWSSVKMVRCLPAAEDWSRDKNISLWVKGYSGCTENLLFYIVENDGDEWAYQSNTVLVNDAWTKVIIPLSDLWDNPWDGSLGDGVKTLTGVTGYKIIVQDIADDGSSPVNKSVCVDELIRDDGAIPPPHLIPDVKNYACYYGEGRVQDLAKLDLVVINPFYYTPEQIASIKATGTAVLGYLAIGADPRPLQIEDGTGPISSGVLCFNGCASYYLDDNPKDGCPDRDEVWGAYYVNAGNALWQNYIINAAKGIIEIKNCDGVFLDTLYAVLPYYSWSRPGMVGLVAALRKAYPDKYIVANRSGVWHFSDFEEYVNGEIIESFTSTYDFDSGIYKKLDQDSLDYHTALANQINTERGYPGQTTVNIFSLDYCRADDSALYTDDYARAESFGFIPSVSDIYLSKIYMVNPANNFKASSIILGKTRAVKLRWEAPQAYVNDSDVMYFVIKRSVLGPIITDAQWENAETLSAKISSSARSFTDTRPPAGTVYYALGALKKSGVQLVGRLTASYSIKKIIKLN